MATPQRIKEMITKGRHPFSITNHPNGTHTYKAVDATQELINKKRSELKLGDTLIVGNQSLTIERCALKV